MQVQNVFIAHVDTDHELEAAGFDGPRLLSVLGQDLQEALTEFGLDVGLDVQGDNGVVGHFATGGGG